MSIDAVARLLVDASVIDVTTDRGTDVEVWTISCDGAYVRASAPRLEVAQDMQLTTRLSIDAMPHAVTLLIEEADVQSQARASLLLLVISVQSAGYQRQNARFSLAATATLTAVVCDRIVPNEQLSGQVADLSESGVRIATPDTRPRSDDRMRLYCRFLEGAIDCEVRVMRASSDLDGRNILGCAFLEPSPETIGVVQRVLARLA